MYVSTDHHCNERKRVVDISTFLKIQINYINVLSRFVSTDTTTAKGLHDNQLIIIS